MSGKELLDEQWRGKEYSYFAHRGCEEFPCHETGDKDNFNCLFCYCPLYALGKGCGGKFQYLPNGVKDCTPCLIPHDRENYGYITGRFQDMYG
ncbi:MAG: cysteine-rich small domain-containing protein [Oscillospiraceae bacterium]|jgi:Zn-finger protein|nr:cysteine-rich small domain-containing protein [Oscillospiraceae bacterium]